MFMRTTIKSHAKPRPAVVDGSLKAQSVDSGLQVIHGQRDLAFIMCPGTPCVVGDTGSVLAMNEKLRVDPGHCDPACHVQDRHVALRGGTVKTLWPDPARSKAP